MGICWYCHWGWAKPVTEIYNRALALLDGFDSPLQYGPSHIVWSDENWDDESIDFCLERCSDKYDYTPEEIEIVRKSLLELKAIPEEQRCIEPEDYDEEHPENFPPTVQVLHHD